MVGLGVDLVFVFSAASLPYLDSSNLSSIHNISNMSSITTLDETVQARLPNGGPLNNLDFSVFRGDLFLDGCKVKFCAWFSMILKMMESSKWYDIWATF